MSTWSSTEESAVAGLYATMLRLQRADTLGRGPGKVSKRKLVLALADLLGRSKGSIEAKLMNCTAAAVDAGLDTVQGYVALPNRSRTLDAVLVAAVANLEA